MKSVRKKKHRLKPRRGEIFRVKTLKLLVVQYAYDARQPGEDLPVRPGKRDGCAEAPRPCPFITCTLNNFSDIHPNSGTLHLNGYSEPAKMKADRSCALDVADTGGVTLEEIGEILHVSRERVRQIETVALRKLKRGGLDPEAMHDMARAEPCDD